MDVNSIPWQDMYDKCAAALKEADDGQTLECWGAGYLLLIGTDWDQEWFEVLDQFVTKWHGSVTIEKGSRWNPTEHGSLTFTGARERSQLQDTIGMFSKKEVLYTD